MLIDFSVENFRSIKELQTFSMSAANIVSKYKEIDESNVIKASDKFSLLKTKAIYGANAGGKSNLIKALQTFISIINNSVKDDECLLEIIPFWLSPKLEPKPSYFQATFLLKGIYYRYGFEATNEEIISEWLFGSPGKKEVQFFVRNTKSIDVNDKQFKEGAKIIDLFSQNDNDVARENSLFLTVVKSFSAGIAREIIDFFAGFLMVSGLDDVHLNKMAIASLGNDALRKQIVDLMKLSDTRISDIGTFETENATKGVETQVYTTHLVYDEELLDGEWTAIFSLSSDESEGTKKMFEVSPLLLKALNECRVLVMDEFDARFHPLLTKQIVELFNSDANKGAQLIFATHDTNLLNAKLLRRDQVCFVEKDKYGASHFYSLVDFKGVRNDASFEKDYISGKYGAIPFLGDFSSIIGD